MEKMNILFAWSFVSAWVSSVFSGFLTLLNKKRVGKLVFIFCERMNMCAHGVLYCIVYS